MKIGGMGDQVIKVEMWELRRLNELSPEIRIVSALPPWNAPRPTPWIPNPIPQPVYLRVRHRYCLRLNPGQLLTYDRFDSFLKSFEDTRRMENDQAGKRLADDELHQLGQRSPMWVDDDTPDEIP